MGGVGGGYKTDLFRMGILASKESSSAVWLLASYLTSL